MEFNKEVILLQNEIKKFAKDVIAEKVDEFDKQGTFPAEIIKRLAEMGILGGTIPESFGGCALDTISLLVCIEEISKVCPSTGLIIATHNILFSYPVAKYGSETQKKLYLQGAAMGEIIGGFAEVTTSEIKVSENTESFLINGKNHILLNGIANGPFIAFAGANGTLNGVIIDGNCPGVKRDKKDNIIGMRASGITQLVFDNCTISKQNLLVDAGSKILKEIKSFANLAFAAINLGISEAAMENAVKYAKERVQFGEPIVNFGMVRELIADMTIKIEAMRLLIYDAASIRDRGKDYSRASAIARYFSNQSVAEITTNAIQVYGGYGYMKDYPVERYFRDAQVSRVLCSSNIETEELIASRTI
ncbi:MAG: acyl-CoA dehydrogenase family protein [bacterium]